jgi:hypothetical protein
MVARGVNTNKMRKVDRPHTPSRVTAALLPRVRAKRIVYDVAKAANIRAAAADK